MAKRRIRTLKEQILHGSYFASQQELQDEIDSAAELYNERWLVQRHGHKTPNQINAEQNERALEEGA